MRLGVPRAAGADPRIVAVTPDVARRLGDLGYEVLVEPGPGTLTVTFQPEDGGEPMEFEVAKFAGGGVAKGMYNFDDSIRDFARASFRYGLSRGFPVYMSTKNTILKAYDGMFKDVFAEIFEAMGGRPVGTPVADDDDLQ
jgi:isocitrate dehydrogenase